MNTVRQSLDLKSNCISTVSFFDRFVTFAFGGLFFLVGFVLMVKLGLTPVVSLCQSMSWQEVPCTIEFVGVKERNQSKGTSYLPDIRYRYYREGKNYQSTRFSWDNAGAHHHDKVKSSLAGYSIGLQTICYVSSRDPNEAVLVRAVRWPILFAILVPGFFATLGFYILQLAFRRQSH